MLGKSKRASRLERINDHPVKAASVVGIVVAVVVIVLGALAQPGASVSNAPALAAALVSVSIARPAYPVLVVVGIVVLVRL